MNRSRRRTGGGSMVRTAALVLAAAALLAGPGTSRAQLPAVVLPDAPEEGSAPGVADWAEWVAEEGGLERARIAVMAEIARASAAEGTLWASLLTVLEQVDGPTAAEAILAVGMAADADGLAASARIMETLPAAGAEARASLLALAAHLAEVEDVARAAELREALLGSHPDAPESIEARLLLGAWLLETSGREEEGLAHLETLITSAPFHSLAPEARRLYDASRAVVR